LGGCCGWVGVVGLEVGVLGAGGWKREEGGDGD